MVERHGFHPIFFLRMADHGVESEAGVFLALDHPSLTMFGRDDLRLLALIFWRNVPNEHVGGFTDMVVYAHENHFVDFHRCLSTCLNMFYQICDGSSLSSVAVGDEPKSSDRKCTRLNSSH